MSTEPAGPHWQAPVASGFTPSFGRAIPPRRVPRDGVMLRLGPGQWQYDTPRGALSVPRPLILVDVEARLDISGWYGGDWVWVRGTELVDGVRVGQRMDVLVDVDAIPDEGAEVGDVHI